MRKIMLACCLFATPVAAQAETIMVPKCVLLVKDRPAYNACMDAYVNGSFQLRESYRIAMEADDVSPPRPRGELSTSGSVSADMDARRLSNDADVELIRMRNRMYPY